MTQVFAMHYWGRHMIDDHNKLQHSVPSIEGSWVTSRWADRVFSFLIAITEVNAYNCFKNFIWKPLKRKTVPTIQQFRKNLAFLLINNPHYTEEEKVVVIRQSKRRKMKEDHKLETAPKFAIKFEGEIDGELKWKKSPKNQIYPQRTCQTFGCKSRIRTFCSCSPGIWKCAGCHHVHVNEEHDKNLLNVLLLLIPVLVV